MLGQLKPASVAIFLALTSVASNQSCIRSEVLAVLEELENRSTPRALLPSNQSGNIACAQIEELNNTIEQGFLEIKGELQGVQQKIREDLQETQQDTKEKLHEVQEDVAEKLQGIKQDIQEELQAVKQLLSRFPSLGFSPSNPAQSCKQISKESSSIYIL